MSENQPPAWGDDSLSRYFRDAEYNARATAANFPRVLALLQRVQDTFEKVEGIIEKDGPATAVPRFLFVRAHAGFLAACRLGMSGHQAEAHAVLRAALENAWYALHMAKDPASPARTELWLRRNESASALTTCKNEFTVKNVRETHEALDPTTAADVKALYEDLIDYGAHPNQLGVLASVLGGKRDGNRVDYKVGILHGERLPILFTLRLAVAVAVGGFKVCRLVYPERFAIAGIDGELDSLVAQLNSEFKQYA